MWWDVSSEDPLLVFDQYMGTTHSLGSGGGVSGGLSAASTSGEDESSESQGLSTLRDDVMRAVIRVGRETITRLMHGADGEGTDPTPTSLTSTAPSSSTKATSIGQRSKIAHLQFDSLSLANFGPYGTPMVHYPLSERGLVLIRGQSRDGTGADSNGSGKTTLAMSIMWGLTGNMDPRLVADGKAVDVAYDSGKAGAPKRTAEVTVKGRINGKAFEVVRRRGPKKAELLFSLDGMDQTTQAVKDTQTIIDETLGIGGGLLQRCCFFGQHSHTLHSLLGLSDVRLKSELAFLVDTELWARCLADVRAREKADKARATELAVELRLRGEEMNRSQGGLEGDLQGVRRLETDLETARSKVSALMGQTYHDLSNRFGGETMAQVTARLEGAVKEVVRAREALEPLRKTLLDTARNTPSSTHSSTPLSRMQPLSPSTGLRGGGGGGSGEEQEIAVLRDAVTATKGMTTQPITFQHISLRLSPELISLPELPLLIPYPYYSSTLTLTRSNSNLTPPTPPHLPTFT